MGRECIAIQLHSSGEHVGDLEACDTHGQGRRTKMWLGHLNGMRVEMRNLKEVAIFTKARGLTFTKVYDAEHDPMCSDYHGPNAPCITR